ncbi:phosphoribosylanthranilate isomerase [Streptococcus suis]|nr:phosphoribosylanthranilate isomerase [Streptococcus suis]
MTKVKICGLSTEEAVRAAVEGDADYMGFVFAPSRRQVSLERAHQLATLIPERMKIVGVFVSPTPTELQLAIGQVPLDIVQIHGDWDESYVQQVPVPVIRAIQLDKAEDISETQAAYLLFDAPIAGSGQTFDWELLTGKQFRQPIFIAGGLTVDNVATAQDLFSPYAVDVSSGVETDGHKDPVKIKAFIERVKK